MKANQTKIAILGKPVKIGAVGGLIILVSAALLSAIAAGCVERGILPEQSGETIGFVIRVASFFLGTAVVGALVEEGKLQAGAVAVGVSLFVLVGITMLVWDGAFANVWLCVLGCVLAGGAGVLLNMVPRKKRSKAGKRYR